MKIPLMEHLKQVVIGRAMPKCGPIQLSVARDARPDDVIVPNLRYKTEITFGVCQVAPDHSEQQIRLRAIEMFHHHLYAPVINELTEITHAMYEEGGGPHEQSFSRVLELIDTLQARQI